MPVIYIFKSMRSTDLQSEILQNTAQAAFQDYALSPDDRNEAIARYVMLGNDGSSEEEKTVEGILYSINCENVWRRDSNTNM